MRGLRLAEFRPSRTTLDRRDVGTVVEEFHAFLEKALRDGERSRTTILEMQ